MFPLQHSKNHASALNTLEIIATVMYVVYFVNPPLSFKSTMDRKDGIAVMRPVELIVNCTLMMV